MFIIAANAAFSNTCYLYQVTHDTIVTGNSGSCIWRGVYADSIDYAMEVHITIKVPRGFLKSQVEVYFNSLRRADVNNTL